MSERRVSRLPLADAIVRAVAGGVDWVQLRERDLSAAALLALGDELLQRGVRTLLVNRRTDVALALGGAGVHLGFDGVCVADARQLLGPTQLLGVSAHTPAEVAAAARDGASYAFLAPIFAPRSKPAERPSLGIAPLAEAARAGIPVLAQGGCDASNAGALVAAGAAGVAVTGAILMHEDPEAAASAIRGALDAAARTRG